MVYIFSRLFLYTFVFTGINQITAGCLSLCHFEGWCLWLWVGPSGLSGPLTEEVYTFIIN